MFRPKDFHRSIPLDWSDLKIVDLSRLDKHSRLEVVEQLNVIPELLNVALDHIRWYNDASESILQLPDSIVEISNILGVLSHYITNGHVPKEIENAKCVLVEEDSSFSLWRPSSAIVCREDGSLVEKQFEREASFLVFSGDILNIQAFLRAFHMWKISHCGQGSSIYRGVRRKGDDAEAATGRRDCCLQTASFAWLVQVFYKQWRMGTLQEIICPNG